MLLVAAIAAALAAGWAASARAQETPGEEAAAWQQRADYTIQTTLDPGTHALSGTETILYTNNSPDTLTLFYLHLYPNAFREKASPLVRDFLQGTLYFFVGLPKSMRGWIDVTKLAVNGDTASFTVDGTILKAAFPKPVPPGGQATFSIAFREKIPPRYARSGYTGDQYDMAQWYPKMVVYDRTGWHPDQYRMGEFYGEFGTFDVSITLPAKYVIAATGMPVEGDAGWTKNPIRRGGRPGGGHPGGRPGARPGAAGGLAAGPGADSLKTVRFRAENVHDFAWCASPTFMVQDTLVGSYRVMAVFNPWNRDWADSMVVREIRAMRWLETFAGPYPYPQVTVVWTPGHGGMEYPMLAMDASADESLTLHELAHMYFYGILGNNERAEAWLDEGFANYCVFRNAVERYGPYGKRDERRFPFSLFPERRMWDGLARPIVNLHRTGYAERIATPAHEYRNGFTTMPYVGAPLFLRALRYNVGDEKFDEIVHTYVERYRFKHVSEDDFRSVCEEASGLALGDFFKEWLHTTKDCDYRISRLKSKAGPNGYVTSLRVERKGEMIEPLALVFRLKNGATAVERMPGVARVADTTFTFEAKAVSAAINPYNEILDVYQLDNFAPRRRSLALDVPFNGYYPVDSYQFRLLPIGYYNDVDGGKLGLRVRGSYDDYYRKFTLQGLYGFESGKIDYYGAYEGPLPYFGRDASMAASVFDREGRRGARFDLFKIRRKSLFDPLAQYVELHVGYHELVDSAYVFPFTYEKGLNLWGGAAFSMKPKTDLFASEFRLTYDRTLWWSDTNYETFTATAKVTPGVRIAFPLKPYARLFVGHAAIAPPLQDRFALAGANAMAKENYFWLRSVGAFPRDQYNNFHVAGDANLRGYYDGTFAFKSVVAANVELQLPFPLPVSRKTSRILDRRLSLFYDVGKVLDERPLEGVPPETRALFDEKTFDGVISDFGVSVSLWKITAEFPLYLSDPHLVQNADQWDFRWTIGFTRLF